MDNLNKCEIAVQTFYICDRQACEKCNPDCKHTSNIEHAKNFESLNENLKDIYVEKDE